MISYCNSKDKRTVPYLLYIPVFSIVQYLGCTGRCQSAALAVRPEKTYHAARRSCRHNPDKERTVLSTIYWYLQIPMQQ